ncbi:hypothetical protein [Paenibacillus sp. NPDC055715]
MTPTAYMAKQSVSRLREMSHDEQMDYDIRVQAEAELLRRTGVGSNGQNEAEK